MCKRSNDPSAKTMKQINDVFRDNLGGHVMQQHEIHNGLIEFWCLGGGEVIIVHAYKGDDGWTHYNESKSRTIDDIIKELS